jgi:hypothetical protein
MRAKGYFKMPAKFIIILILAVIMVMLFGMTINGQSVSDFKFRQLNFLDQYGALRVENSDWGQASFYIFPANDGIVRYLNITASAGNETGWIVRNYPVLPDEFINPGIFVLYFDFKELGVGTGEDVREIKYIAEVTSTLRNSGPVGDMTLASIDKLDIRRFGRLIPGRDNTFEGPGQLVPPYITRAVNKRLLVKSEDVPGVQEGDNECASGATARSLKWLSDNHNLGMPTVEEIQDDLAQPQYMNQGVTDEEMINAKRQYIEDENLPLTVSYWYARNYYPTGLNTPGVPSVNSEDIDMIDFLHQELSRGQDIELNFDWASGGGHSVTLVGVDKVNQTIEYRDDEAQGNDGEGDEGYKEATLIPRGNGEYDFDGAGNYIAAAVVECPKRQVPSLTNYGLIILIVLLIAAGFYVFMKRRKATIMAS